MNSIPNVTAGCLKELKLDHRLFRQDLSTDDILDLRDQLSRFSSLDKLSLMGVSFPRARETPREPSLLRTIIEAVDSLSQVSRLTRLSAVRRDV